MSGFAEVWLDAAWAGPGLFTPPIPFDPADRGLLLADGAFDTSLVLGHRMIWRERHVARLVEACGSLGFELQAARVERAIEAMLPRIQHGALRLTATRGPGLRGLAPPAAPRPTLLAAVAPLRTGGLFAPAALRTSAIRRNETSPLSRIKGLAYADAVLAAGGAADGEDALFLNTCGAIVCAGTANLFAVIDGRFVTPPLADGALNGITRRALLAAAPGSGLSIGEGSMTAADLRRATAVLLTSSLRLVSRVVTLDGRPLPGDGIADRITDILADAVRADIGIDPRRPPQ